MGSSIFELKQLPGSEEAAAAELVDAARADVRRAGVVAALPAAESDRVLFTGTADGDISGDVAAFEVRRPRRAGSAADVDAKLTGSGSGLLSLTEFSGMGDSLVAVTEAGARRPGVRVDGDGAVCEAAAETSGVFGSLDFLAGVDLGDSGSEDAARVLRRVVVSGVPAGEGAAVFLDDLGVDRVDVSGFRCVTMSGL
jgi:hypothetical protein